MPVNLNALIRYKTIDRCLRNKYICCDILRLQEECTEALSESRGKLTKVSERTIRDDIRVMRSDILGFNAPIELIDNAYRYSDPEYSIFDITIEKRELMLAIIELLWENRKTINNPMLPDILNELCDITGTALPEEELPMKDVVMEDVPQAHDMSYEEESETTHAFIHRLNYKAAESLEWKKVLRLI